MELPVLAGIALAIFAIWFVCAPLVRSEEEIQPLYRSRPGVRHLYGPTGDETSERTTDEETSERDFVPLLEDGQVRCLQCGTVNDTTYDYCEECVEPLT